MRLGEEALVHELSDCEPISSEEKFRLARLARAGDAEAKKELVRSSLRLVYWLAKRYEGRGIEVEDLVQEGTLGLIKAAERFDPDRGFEFSTYATWWIRQAIGRLLRDQTRVVRAPSYAVDAILAFNRERDRIYNEEGRVPTPEEVAHNIRDKFPGSKPERIRQILKATEKALQGHVELEGTGVDPGREDDGFDDLENEEIRSIAHEVVWSILRERFRDRDLEIVRLRWGGLSLHQVGERVGITKERVRQIEMKARGYVLARLPSYMIQRGERNAKR